MAASTARFSPAALPMPISAEPAFCIIALTSAKSTLISPGMVMISEIPCTPWRKISSQVKKASVKDVFLSMISSRRSLGMVMMVSTLSDKRACARSLISRRCIPSKTKGLVTTATVRAPKSRAISATIGDAPEPVPPPSPQVTKTISAPFNISRISLWLSSAAFCPISGSIPAPSPRETDFPMWSFCGAMQWLSAWTSVFIAINSMPLILA